MVIYLSKMVYLLLNTSTGKAVVEYVHDVLTCGFLGDLEPFWCVWTLPENTTFRLEQILTNVVPTVHGQGEGTHIVAQGSEELGKQASHRRGCRFCVN